MTPFKKYITEDSSIRKDNNLKQLQRALQAAVKHAKNLERSYKDDDFLEDKIEEIKSPLEDALYDVNDLIKRG